MNAQHKVNGVLIRNPCRWHHWWARIWCGQECHSCFCASSVQEWQRLCLLSLIRYPVGCGRCQEARQKVDCQHVTGDSVHCSQRQHLGSSHHVRCKRWLAYYRCLWEFSKVGEQDRVNEDKLLTYYLLVMPVMWCLPVTPTFILSLLLIRLTLWTLEAAMENVSLSQLLVSVSSK